MQPSVPRHAFQFRYWPTWLVIALAWLLARLPVPSHDWLGRMISSLLVFSGARRGRIARKNLELCFPEYSAREQERLTRRCLTELATGTLEMAVAWLRPRFDPTPATAIIGREHLDAALATGRGVILVGGHFAVMDMIARPLSSLGPIDVIYRKNKDPVWEWMQVHGRGHYFDGVHERSNMRAILRALKAGRAIWYAADQDYGRQHSVFAPFFNIPAATITAAARLARLNDSVVLFMSQHRNLPTANGSQASSQRWTLRFSPPISPYPTGDDLADATRLNALLEHEILRDPAQYLWVHKRFKTRPEGKADFYPK